MAPGKNAPPPKSHRLVCAEFRRGRGYRHRRPQGSGDCLLIYTEGGSGRIVSPAGSHLTRPGEVLIYGPGDLQDYATEPRTGRWHLLWVHFVPRLPWEVWLRWPANEAGLKSLRLEGEIQREFAAAMRRMIHVSRRKIPFASDLAANALEEALLWANVAASRDTWLSLDPRVRQAIDHLVSNSRAPFRLDALARHCGVSVSRLAHLFKQQTGATPQQFAERHRLEHAGELLRLTGLSVAEVAAETGYADAFYFSTRFRRHTGHSPLQFRKIRARE